jgi:hypothetical protein
LRGGATGGDPAEAPLTGIAAGVQRIFVFWTHTGR